MSAIIGTAGWSLPRAVADRFGEGASNLARYATRFGGVEINSSFHRSHRRSVWQRWAASVPARFRFAAKVPKTVTHGRKLVDCGELLRAFAEEAGGLGDKLSVLLVQLPPKLAFDAGVAERFFEELAGLTDARIACEPRHPSWFDDAPDAMLAGLRVSRVAADPAVVPAAAEPGGWRGLAYHRLHGSPDMYRSSYADGRLESYAAKLRGNGEAWCMFDNTASGAAAGDALALVGMLGSPA